MVLPVVGSRKADVAADLPGWAMTQFARCLEEIRS
jgi:hypothetical protein